ncbi:hypothetical protein VP1G_02733 [Cytospora mali]|uniref:GPI anchored serine-threonine rich protein n=1 Tax=Cytospora mali TaxID=578113 RepID=A0A194UUU7_CYTMA|nr:hypothetical protein VP1G_02733 [Valsa mali var. pyri (nom. inval.)]
MKAIIFSFTALLASALAQSATSSAVSSTSSCAAEYIVDQCLSDTEARQKQCDTTDYSCQCAAYQAEYTCFNNCPHDSRQSTYGGLVSQYCALASQYSSTNTASSTAASSALSSATGSAVTTVTGTATKGTSTADSTSSASANSSANSAADLALSAGGML